MITNSACWNCCRQYKIEYETCPYCEAANPNVNLEFANKQAICDHEWQFQDDSFDHEFGTERVHYWRCENCDLTKSMEPGDYHSED